MPEQNWPPLFDEQKCPEAVADKVDFNFISDCTVLPAPDPIFDCPDLAIPPEPPIPVVPCPTFIAGGTGSSNVQFNVDLSVKQSTCQSSATAGGQLELVFTSDDCCNFLFDLDLDLNLDLAICIPPPPCPTFDVSGTATLNADAGGIDCNTTPSAGLVISAVTTSGSSGCEVAFDFEFDLIVPPPPVPCPVLTGGAAATATGGGSTGDCGGDTSVAAALTITPTESGDPCNPDCDFDFDFDFDFQFPRQPIPCPTITATTDTTTTVSEGAPQVSATVSVSPNESGDPCSPTCTFDFIFDFAFTLPPAIPGPAGPCPNVTGSATATTGTGTSADATLTVTQTGSDSNCAYLFDFDFTLVPGPEGSRGPEGSQGPPGNTGPAGPCPVISATATATEGTDPLEGPNAEVVVTKPNLSECTYDFDFEFTFPPPCTPSFEATASAVEVACSAAPQVTVDVTKVGECDWEFAFDFEIPPGCQGPSGAPGEQGPSGAPGEKMAIVPVLDHDLPAPPPEEREYVGLFCTEMPEVRFEDILTVELGRCGIGTSVIDPIFLRVCEPGSIKVISAVSTTPTALGAWVEDGKVFVRAADIATRGVATVKISGIRRGHKSRFTRYTHEHYVKNLHFWDGWKN